MGKNCLRCKQSSVSSAKRFRDLNSPTFLIFIRFCSNRNQLWAASAQSAADGPIAVIHLVGDENKVSFGGTRSARPMERLPRWRVRCPADRNALRTAHTTTSFSRCRALVGRGGSPNRPRAIESIAPTCRTTDRPNHSPSCTRAASFAASTPSDLRPGNTTFWTGPSAAEE